MKKVLCCLLTVLLAVSTLCAGCRSEDAPLDTTTVFSTTAPSTVPTVSKEYSPFVEQPSIQTIGTVHEEDLTAIYTPEPTVYPFFLTNSYMWYLNEENVIYQSDWRTGETKTLGEYRFGMTLEQFTQTSDGSVWTSFSTGDTDSMGMVVGGEMAYLVRFDEEQSTYTLVKEWADTSMFIKLVGVGETLIVSRIVDEGSAMVYLIEKHHIGNGTGEVLVEKRVTKGEGSTIYTIDVDGDNIYALISTVTGKEEDALCYQLVRYDLNGTELEVYDMPDYNEAFLRIHSGSLDMTVFDEYVSIKSLQGYSAVFQLQKGVAKRIYFTDNRLESERYVPEKPMPIPVIYDCGEADNRFVFFYVSNAEKRQFLIYDRQKKAFRSVELDTGNKYPNCINSNYDVVFGESEQKSAREWQYNYFIVNIRSILLTE